MRALVLSLSIVTLACSQSTATPSPDAALEDASLVDAYRAPRVDAGRDSGPIPEDLQGFVEYQMSLGRIPGLAAAVMDHGEIVRVVVAGRATPTTPVDEHTLFLLASISKTFTCALLQGLAEEGRITLDDPIATHLGYPVRSPMSPDHPVTIRELMDHTSGLVDDWIVLGNATTVGDPTTTLAGFARTYLEDTTHFAAASGTMFSYSNAGFAVLGAVIEAASGEDLRARTTRTLLDPLALDGAGWFLADIDVMRLANEYTSTPTSYSPMNHEGFGFYPATSMHMSITGMSRWLLTHIDNGELDGVRILSEASVLEQRRLQAPSLDPNQGLAWYYVPMDSVRWLGHTGSTLGVTTTMMYREDGRGVVILTNSDASFRERLGQHNGMDAINAIFVRLNQEADMLAMSR